MIGLFALGVDVGWSEAEPFGCAESVDSVREISVTRETDLVLWAGLVEHDVRTSDDLSVLGVPESVSDLSIRSIPEENAFP